MGHDIAPGQSYCPMGHPLALEGMQFAGGQQGGGYGGYPQPQMPAQPQYAPQGYAPPPGYAPPQPPYAPPPPPAPEPMAAPPLAPGARVLRGFLVSFQSNAAGDFWPLNSGRLTVGRSNSGEALDVPLADATISSRHAVITVDASSGTIQVEDTGSTNGTFVNDEHLGFNGRRELRDGDRVRFGGYTTIVKVIGRV